MSDHFDAAYPQTDITDLYVFPKPDDPTRSILILNVNPDAPRRASTFDPEASYEFKIDTNGDARADIAYHVLFAKDGSGRQTATVYRATGASAEDSGAVGEALIKGAPTSFDEEARITEQGAYRFYAGLRSDPFFVDPEGFFNNFQWTGRDANAQANVFGIVLEVPNSALGPSPRIGVWARTIAQVHGAPHQIDLVGRPGATPLFMQSEEDKHAFHGSQPGEQQALFGPTVVAVLQAFGFDEAEAQEQAGAWLPDVLPYDYTSTAGYPNGRKLADDTIDWVVSYLTRGAMTADLVEPHTDYLADFPYLGPPHPLPE